MENDKLVILYGSETGTAIDAAEQIQEMAFERDIADCTVQSLNDFDVVQNLPHVKIAVFCVATTGDGVAPGNMRKAWQFLLRKSLHSGWLEGVQVAVFGLGDSSYDKYNAVARKLDARLQQLGAQRLIPRGLGDDQHPRGYFGAFIPWLEEFWKHVLPILSPYYQIRENPDSAQSALTRIDMMKNTILLEILPYSEPLSTVSSSSNFYDPPEDTIHPEGGLCRGTVTCNKSLTAEDWTQDVRHIEISLSDALFPFQPGSIAVIYPENDEKCVSNLIEYVSKTTDLPSRGNSVVKIISNAKEKVVIDDKRDLLSFPNPTRLHDLFKKYLDINGTPRRSFFSRISHYAKSSEERDKLVELSSPEGADLLYDYCIREKKTYVEILLDFPSVRLPLNTLLQLIPSQRPRLYSIASSYLMHPDKIHLCVAILETLTPYKRNRVGVCSEYLRSLTPGQDVLFWIKSGCIKCPALESNVILIGPGTGLAPLRAILQERQMVQNQMNNPSEREKHSAIIGKVGLYHGCRHEHKDYLYRDELHSYLSTGALQALHTAFSRDQSHKIYVQTRLEEQKAAVYHHLINEGFCIIAGSSKRMPSDVYETFLNILQSEGGMSVTEAEQMMKYLLRTKRYIVESW
nr:NADPHdependent diflavin oxidoreductase putative [Albugo laibachii Nc14]|eukprot:CCA16717.1 NADPHdependent diflavin oxidoreductase putative [Albugo laibachii Nc14]